MVEQAIVEEVVAGLPEDYTTNDVAVELSAGSVVADITVAPREVDDAQMLIGVIGINDADISAGQSERLTHQRVTCYTDGQVKAGRLKGVFSVYSFYVKKNMFSTKNWKWLCLAWKMLPHPSRLFLSYLEVPSGHIFKKPNKI